MSPSGVDLAALRERARFFADVAELRAWFEAHHADTPELWIAYPKKGVDRAAVRYPEAVEEALCFGWVDGQVRSLDAESYTNRYTPRTTRSPWSQANVAKVERLRRAGRMHAAGLRAFDARDPTRRAGYVFEEPDRPFAVGETRRFRARPVAWRFFERQPPSYRKLWRFWVLRAVRPEVRRRRLDRLIEVSAAGRRLDPLAPMRRTLPAPVARATAGAGPSRRRAR